MGIFVGQGVEATATILTLVWLCVGVNIQVLFEMSLHSKAFLAELALERLLVVWRVNIDDMVLENISRCAHFAT